MVTGATTVAAIRQWAYGIASDLTPAKTVADLLTPGATITLTAPPAPPAPTAKETWLGKANRLLRLTELGLTNATAVSDLAALRADVNATYDSTYL